ncbi:MAG: hypothetical protein KJZ65_02870 [Phycisphaerales bacterium]|nr:hypothetical protein [Phycisphaerales bacterium]
MRAISMSAIVAFALAGAAQADIVNISGSVMNSTEQTGANYTGTLDYTYGGGSSGTLIVSLTNTTPGGVGGFLTGFVFNINSTDAGASAILTSTTNANFLNTGNESASPYGNFDAGAALGANWTGGGSPADGIAVGGSATFTFAVTALDANLLSASSFMNGPNQWNFLVRFRGLANGGSDKVPGVPAPGALALLGLGAAAARRRR